MSLEPINVLPGIYTEASPRTALNRYISGLNIRFFRGFAEKVKGWLKASTVGITFDGVCRALLSWTSLTGAKYIGVGTNTKLYVYSDGAYYDVTPIADTGTLDTDPFTTINASSTVTVHDIAHGRSTGDHVHFSGATATGGLDPNGEWIVTGITDTDNYTFVHTGTSSSGATGGGAAVDYDYELPVGLVDALAGGGWGGGGWGAGAWGTVRDVIEQARTWSLGNWGEDMIASPFKGSIYVWQASGGTSSRATLISGAPEQNLLVRVSSQSRQLIAFGSTDPSTSVLDPMLIQFSDNEDYTDWTSTDTNQAGFKRLDVGNAIIAAELSRGQFVVLTDQSLYTMALSGDAFVFNFVTEGAAIGGVGPNCGFDINGTYYYMGRGQFCKYDGVLSVVPCDVLSFVFTVNTDRGFLGINMEQSSKVQCRRNKSRSELIWFYCSNGSDEIDRCVGYCYEPGQEAWWLGNVSATAWLDENVLFEEPISARTEGYLYVQETGVDADVDADGNPVALPYSLKTYDLEMPGSSAFASSYNGPGDMIIQVHYLFPDFQRIAGNHKATLKGRKFPNEREKVKGPRRFNERSKQIGLSMRARQISITIESSSTGADISMGQWRAEVEPVGEQ